MKPSGTRALFNDREISVICRASLTLSQTSTTKDRCCNKAVEFADIRLKRFRVFREDFCILPWLHGERVEDHEPSLPSPTGYLAADMEFVIGCPLTMPFQCHHFGQVALKRAVLSGAGRA